MSLVPWRAVAMAMLVGRGAVGAQQPSMWERAATEIVRNLAAGRVDLAVAAVDSSVAKTLTADLLGQAWRAMAANGGALTGVVARESGVVGSNHIVEVQATLERGSVPLRIALTAAGKMVGIFRSQLAAPPWDPPPYATPAAIREIEITIGSAPWTLPATLTVPSGSARAPIVVLVHGSGPNDRDETSPGGTKLFKDLAWGLASRGIAVLRYDKRTFAYRAALAARAGSVTVEEEVLTDALAALAAARHRPEVDSARVLLLGHSLGAGLAPEIAARDGRTAGVILLAGTPRPLSRVLVDQIQYLTTLGQPRDTVLLAQLAALAAHRVAPGTMVMGAPASYWYDLDARDPMARALAVTAPMFIAQGGRDYQVTMADLALWQRGLRARAAPTTFKDYPALNHYFVEGVGMATPTEYVTTHGHASALLIDDLAKWILAR